MAYKKISRNDAFMNAANVEDDEANFHLSMRSKKEIFSITMGQDY